LRQRRRLDQTPCIAPPHLFRVILPVSDIEAAASFYARLLDLPGVRVSGGRHYFDCAGTILACYDALADGDSERVGPNPQHVYFGVDDLDAAHARAERAGCRELTEIEVRPWGERSFYARDPFENPICFVDSQTLFTGEQAWAET
jgi:catechol 2,3-dioxygenase-like lactoylglutathione lyase family enzyme